MIRRSTLKRRNLVRSIASCLLGSGIALSSSAQAANLFWQGNAGSWSNGSSGWGTTAAGPFTTNWNNTNIDTALFGGTAGTVTLGTAITVGGLQFNTTAYTIDTSTFALNFSGTSNIVFNNIAAATINNSVGGTGSVVLTSTNPLTAGTLTLGLTSTGGWSGTTTINPGMTLSLTGANQGLLNTSGITLDGGNITTTNTNAAQSTLNRINDAAAITSNGGTFTFTNTAGANLNYTETLGSVELSRGQTNFVLTTNQSNATNNSQTLILTGLTRSGSSNTSVAAFLAGGTGPQINTGDNMIRVNGVTTSTPAGQIIGPWASTGVSATSQSDYARYVSDGTNGFITAAGIAHSLENTWTTAANSYTFNGATAKGAAALTATRNMTGLKINTVTVATDTNGTDATNDTITWTGHTFVEGAPFYAAGTVPTGLTAGTVYYARNPSGNTFQVSATPTGAIIDLTSTSGITAIAPGVLVSSGNNLGTTGILTTEGVNNVITAAGTGVVTLPSTTSAPLYVSTVGPGASNLIILAPITDNGAGVLTLVKSGIGGGTAGTQGVLTLGGANTYTGGTVLHAGTLAISNAMALGTGPVSVTGDSRINATGGITYANAISIDANRTLSFQHTGAANTTATFSGPITGNAGVTLVSKGGNVAGTIALSSMSNNFTGSILLPTGSGSNDFISFGSIGDGGSIIYGRSGWRSVATYTGSANLSLNSRSISLASGFGGLSTAGLDGGGAPINMLANDGTGVVTINSDMVVSGSVASGNFFFGGTSLANNTFAGAIPDIAGANTLGIGKWDAGKWILTSNASSYEGIALIGNGTLSVPVISTIANAQPLGKGPLIQLGHGNSTGTLEFTGSTDSGTDKQILLGNLNNNNQTGGGIILNNGTGSLTFSNSTFNALSNITGAQAFNLTTIDRTLTLGGSYNGTSFNEIQGTIQDHVAGAAQVILTVSGSSWKLSGTNTYTGGTSVNGGTLALSGNNTVSPTTGSLTVNASTLRLEANAGNTSSGISSAIGYTTGSAAGNASPGLIVGTTGATFQLRSDSNVTFTGTSGIGGISSKTITIDVANNGSGSNNAITFSPNGNVYGGTNTVNITGSNGYSLIIGNWNSNNTGGTLTFNPTTASVTVGTMTANTGTPTRTVALDGTATGNSVGAITSLNYSVTKSNSSTWTLTGTNTYTGTTTVSAGTLVVAGSGSTAAGSAVTVNGGWLLANGTVGGTVNVNTGGTLGGTGIVGGAVTVGAGGTLAPGASPGQLTLNTSLTLNSTSNSVFELGGTTLGNDYDNVNLSSASSIAFGGNLSVVNFGMFNMDAVENTYDLFNLGSLTSATSFTRVTVNSIALTNNSGVWTGASGQANYQFTESTGDLAITAIPEPSTLVLGGLAVLGFVGINLRRRRMTIAKPQA